MSSYFGKVNLLIWEIQKLLPYLLYCFCVLSIDSTTLFRSKSYFWVTRLNIFAGSRRSKNKEPKTKIPVFWSCLCLLSNIALSVCVLVFAIMFWKYCVYSTFLSSTLRRASSLCAIHFVPVGFIWSPQICIFLLEVHVTILFLKFFYLAFYKDSKDSWNTL